MDLADKMRVQNPEQFNTLVKMHLSFELDLNNEIEKVKFKKRFNLHKKTKVCASHPKTNSPLCGSFNVLSTGITQLRQLIEFLLLEQNITQEGIFRRTGSVARQNELKSKVSAGGVLALENGTYSVHDCASVLKAFIADLPEPLLTDMYYPVHCAMAELYNNPDKSDAKTTRLIYSLQLLMLLLPEENRILLKEIILMLNETIKYEKNNKMSADSLATLFTPHLICPKNLTPEALHTTAQSMSGVISFMITKGSTIFDIPPKLATDMRAYFVDRKRKQTMCPDNVLDESATANTVYTFVDRERTAQAHTQNPTDTGLAQLYAYIQSIPESSKKRKLIKQFNKENGHGTPLQLQMLHRLKSSTTTSKSNSKSLGDSLKRHLFQKFSSTPSAASTNTTPNRFQQKPTKSRVLFHSPATATVTSTTSIQLEQLKTTSCPTTSTQVTTALAEKQTEKQIPPKKSVEFQGTVLLQDHSEKLNSSPETDLQRSRFKSEPNLSTILRESNISSTVSVTSKLGKGVSMFNLTIQQSIMDKTKSKSEDNLLVSECVNDFQSPIHVQEEEEEDLDDPDFEESEDDENDDHTPVNFYSTRQSMSPITKSTQRMSKAMQESIMTPRSRKPLMLPGVSLLSKAENDATDAVTTVTATDTETDSLTTSFRNYLTSPMDSSFSSQPDDFGSPLELQSESELSESLLYCLNGNMPEDFVADPEHSSRKRAASEINLCANEQQSKKFFSLESCKDESPYAVLPGETSL